MRRERLRIPLRKKNLKERLVAHSLQVEMTLTSYRIKQVLVCLPLVFPPKLHLSQLLSQLQPHRLTPLLEVVVALASHLPCNLHL